MNKFSFLELTGTVHVADIVILIVSQDELEDGRWTLRWASLDKFDIYFYETVYRSAQTYWKALYTFQMNITVGDRGQRTGRLE